MVAGPPPCQGLAGVGSSWVSFRRVARLPAPPSLVSVIWMSPKWPASLDYLKLTERSEVHVDFPIANREGPTPVRANFARRMTGVGRGVAPRSLPSRRSSLLHEGVFVVSRASSSAIVTGAKRFQQEYGYRLNVEIKRALDVIDLTAFDSRFLVGAT